jgi:hypothetical protein
VASDDVLELLPVGLGVLPDAIARTTSRPWRMWNDSSQQIFFMIRAYGAYDVFKSAFCEMIAAASTSQAMTPTSPQLRVG